MSTYLDKVHQSCSFVKEKSSIVKVNSEAIPKFLKELNKDEFQKLTKISKLPFTFTSIMEEINFLSTIDLLQFGSGYRHLLHKYCGNGAASVIQFGIISIHISNISIDANFMKNISLADVGQYFNIPLTQEKKISVIATMEEPSPVCPFAQQIQTVLNETGDILLSNGFPSLGHFILSIIEREKQNQNIASCLVESLAKAFPALRDITIWEGEEIYILKKAQLIVGTLHRQFSEQDKQFDFPDISKLSIFADNVIPCVLNELGIIEVDPSLKKRIDDQEELKSNELLDLQLRAVSISACDEIIQVAQSEAFKDLGLGHLRNLDLDFYFWTLGKEPRFRSLQRHKTCDTVYY